MRANPRKDTKLEVQVRQILHSQGYRFRKDFPIVVNGLRVRPDIVFTRLKLAVFLDGCFWHSCPEHGNQPRANREYWQAKLEKNRMRDTLVNSTLRKAGWSVMRIWEHIPPREAATAVIQQLSEREQDVDNR